MIVIWFRLSSNGQNIDANNSREDENIYPHLKTILCFPYIKSGPLTTYVFIKTYFLRWVMVTAIVLRRYMALQRSLIQNKNVMSCELLSNMNLLLW